MLRNWSGVCSRDCELMVAFRACLSTDGVPPSCPTAIWAFWALMAFVTSVAVIWTLFSLLGSSQMRIEYCEP